MRYITVKKDSSVSMHGIDHPPAKLIKRTPNGILIIKINGGSYWAGLGIPRGYAGAEYLIVKIQQSLPTDSIGEHFDVEQLVRFPVRS